MLLPTALSVAPLTLAAVLVLSALAKARDVDSTRSVIAVLRLPAGLQTLAVARSLPAIELAAALLLLSPWWPGYVVGASLTLVLMLTFWAVIARALRFEERPVCGCFGRIGNHQVNAWTLVRNTLLVGLAGVAVWVAVAGGTGTGLMSAYTSADWVWLVLALALGSVAALVLAPVRTDPEPTPGQEGSMRSRAPEAPGRGPGYGAVRGERRADAAIMQAVLVDREHEAVPLVTLAGGEPRVLVLANCWCGPTMESLRRLARWRARLPAAGVQLVLTPYPFDAPQAQGVHGIWWDPGAVVYAGLAGTHSPTAVLLGSGGQLVGGPVSGVEAIEAFVELLAEKRDDQPSGSAPI